jgi:hypothetical protein
MRGFESSRTDVRPLTLIGAALGLYRIERATLWIGEGSKLLILGNKMPLTRAAPNGGCCGMTISALTWSDEPATCFNFAKSLKCRRAKF